MKISSIGSVWYRILINIFAVFTVLQCESVYISNIFYESIVNGLWQVLLFIICIYFLYRLNNDINHTYVNKLFSFISCYFIVTFVILIFYYIYSPFTPFYFLLILIDPIMLMICFVGSIKNNSMIGKYLFYRIDDIVLVLAIISLIFWFLELKGMAPNMSTIIKWGGIHRIQGYDYIQFIPQNGSFSFLGESLVRNTGIFVEAPIYSYILNITLLVELYMKKKSSKYRIVILLITIFSTTSTTGLIVALLAIFYYVFIRLNSYRKYLLFIFVPFLFIIINKIFLSKIYSPGSSYNKRTFEWNIDVVDWHQHLFIGNGLPTIGNSPSRNPGINIGLSSGIMAVLAFGGLVFVMFYILPSVCSLFVSKRIFGISVLSFILFIYTIVMNLYIYIIILSYLWVTVIIKNSRNELNESD